MFMIGHIFSWLFRYTWDQYYQQWWRHQQNPRWPPKTKVVIFTVFSMPVPSPTCVDAVQKFPWQYLFRFLNWNVPKIRITCFATLTSYMQNEHALGDSDKHVIDFVSLYAIQVESIIGGRFPHWFVETGNDVTMTSSACFSRRVLLNVNLSIESCCLQLVMDA